MPLNDLWVLSPTNALGSGAGLDDTVTVAAEGNGSTDTYLSCVWSLVLLDGVGPSPRSLASLTPTPGSGDLFLFGGFGLVELPATAGSKGAIADGREEEEEEEGGEIIMAYIDDLWRLSLGGGAISASSTEWVDEEGMGFAGESIVEGRNGHTLTWCGEKLILFGGYVGDGFDGGVHAAEAPSALRPPVL